MMSATLPFGSFLVGGSGDGATFQEQQENLKVDLGVTTGYTGADDLGPITMALTGDNPGTLSGTTTASPSNGLVTFADLKLSGPGDYTLAATDAAGQAVSGPIHVHVKAQTDPSQLAVLSGPTLDPATGTVSLTVGVEDANGKLVPNTPGNTADPVLLDATGPDGGTILYNHLTDRSFSLSPTINADGTQTFTGLNATAAGTYAFYVNDWAGFAGVKTGEVAMPANPLPVNVQYGLPPTTPTAAPTATAAAITTTDSPPATKAARRAAAKAARAEVAAARKAAHAAKIAAHRAAVAAHHQAAVV